MGYSNTRLTWKSSAVAIGLVMCTIGTAFDAKAQTADAERPFEWAGSYVGLQLGQGWTDAKFLDSEYNGAPPFPTVRWGVDADGLMFGINAGRNWRRDSFVYGLEGELGRLNLKGHEFPPGVDPIIFDPYDASGVVHGGAYGGLSARAGFVRNRTTLFYGKAGLVYSRAKLGFVDDCTTAPCGDGSINASKKVGWGVQLGAGVEHALSQRWTVKAEYAYMNFGKTTIVGQGLSGGSLGNTFRTRADLSVHSVKVGVNYKF